MKMTKKKNNNWKVKLLNKKIIALFLSVAIAISIIIWTFSSTISFIIGGGSTSVLPVMNNLTERYVQISKNKTKILYNGLGSASALTGVKDGAYAFGLLSESLSDSEQKKLWNQNKVVRFAFARDYIVLMVHLPKSLELSNTVISKKMGNKTYKFLSLGNFGTDKTKQYELTNKIRSIYTNSSNSWENIFGTQLTGNGINDKITSIGRENGSGTRKFFDKSIIKKSDYYQNITTTSNGQMKSNLLNSDKGSIGYLSFDYIEDIVKNPTSNRTYPICYKDKDGKYVLPFKANPNNPDKITFNSQYKVSRLFTGIINTKVKNFEQSMSFIAWMLDYTEKPTNMNADYYYIKNGCEPLSRTDPEGERYNGDSKSKESILYYYNKYKNAIPK